MSHSPEQARIGWAAQKSILKPDPKLEGFHGERRSNTTHVSTTDPEARLARKRPGKEAKLAYHRYAVMDNRHGLVVNACTTQATGTAERQAGGGAGDCAAARDLGRLGLRLLPSRPYVIFARIQDTGYRIYPLPTTHYQPPSELFASFPLVSQFQMVLDHSSQTPDSFLDLVRGYEAETEA